MSDSSSLDSPVSDSSSAPDSPPPPPPAPNAIPETFRISMDRALENLRRATTRANILVSGGTISPTNSPDNSISQEPAIHIANIVIDENGADMQGENELASEPSISSDEE